MSNYRSVKILVQCPNIICLFKDDHGISEGRGCSFLVYISMFLFKATVLASLLSSTKCVLSLITYIILFSTLDQC